MEQAKQSRVHIERILLVCGMPNAGKSTLIRHMYGDARLGSEIPLAGPLRRRALSRERCLAGRATSPHEAGETQDEFHQKIYDACGSASDLFWRINYVCAIQPHARNYMPGIVDVCRGLSMKFMPERIRVIQLSPDQLGRSTSALTQVEIDALRANDVEVLSIDARRSGHSPATGNIRILADYFDFS